MPAGTRPFWITLLAVWSLVFIGGNFYVHQQNIPSTLANALVLAAMIEAAFFLATGFTPVVSRLRRLSRPVSAFLLVISAVLPYLIFSIGAHLYRNASLVALIVLAGVTACWWLVLPRSVLADLLFLVWIAAGVLAKPFPLIYGNLLAANSLGQMMWLHTSIFAALLVGRVEDPRLGFWPSAREWRIGFVTFAVFLPVAFVLGITLKFARFHPAPGWTWKAVPLFLGMLWVVAYREEFFFRGLLQRWLARWLHGKATGLVAASILFGSVHLFFRQFPNWRFAVIAAVAGLFYGWAFDRGGGVRAPMVAHALVNATWRLLFTS